MATAKETALWGAFNLGHPFKQNMQVVKMSEDSLMVEHVRHVCVQSKGFTYLKHFETVIQDFLKYQKVDVWGCPHCGKLYWYTQEYGQVLGEQAVMLRQYKKMLEMNGYSTQVIPNQAYYNVVMQGDDSHMVMSELSNDWETSSYVEDNDIQYEPMDAFAVEEEVDTVKDNMNDMLSQFKNW